jgi:hypothetical protein
MYIGIRRRLSDEILGKRPGKRRTNSWFLHHDNAPAHRSVFVNDFLSKKNVTTLNNPPYSLDLAAADVYPFPRLKSAVKERRFIYTTGIIRNATGELKRLSRYGFNTCFQHLYSRWQKCVVATA